MNCEYLGRGLEQGAEACARQSQGGPILSTPTPQQLLQKWLERQLGAEARAWLRARTAGAGEAAGAEREFLIAFGLVPRKVGKEDLQLSAGDLAEAAQARPGWVPRWWSVDQAARLLLLLGRPATEAEVFRRRLDLLCATAEVGELVALYRGLPLYPFPEAHVGRAAEGIRSNMRPVFEAVALDNPYPAEWLDEGAWNQMVLKALFVGSRLWPIQGLERRSNRVLARMLSDYAHERWAARRSISPELWRCVGLHADEAMVTDLERVLLQGGEWERRAAVLALRSCALPRARSLLERAPQLAAGAEAGEFDWVQVGRAG